MLGRSFQKRLAFLVTGLAACVPITRMCAQASSSSSEEDTRQFCARVTTQPLTPPSFAHPVSEAELQSCDSAALYYGFDRPPDPGAALQCAYYQRAHPDPSRGDPFAGPGVLTMLYANGKGVSRNYDLALLFACETWGAPLETDARVVHLQDLRRTHAVISNFDLCDGMTSGLMQGACGSVRERFADGKRGKELAIIKGHWPAQVQEAFKSLQDAEKDFEDARVKNEVDLTGTGRAAFSLRERGQLRDQFLINLKRFAKNDVPRTSAAAARDVDRRLNLVYQQIQHSPPDAWQYTTVKPSAIRDTERAWLKLRDAWVEFGRLAYPSLNTTSLVAQLNRLRLHQLQSLAQTAPTNAKSPQQPTRPEVKYFAKKSGNTFLANVLLATANGKTYELIGKSKQKCMRLIAQKDFDGNGSLDALVEHITACGGNCCSDSFFFVSSFDNGRFEISKEFADSWKDPVVEKWNGRWSVVVISSNAGTNLDRLVEVTRRFALEKGEAIKVEETRRQDIKSLVEMRSEMFASEMSRGNEDDPHTIEYDLDGDGTKDVISGKLWQRWGSIVWSVRFSNGKEFSSDQACKRIGVLATKTNGVNDIVCDQDTVLHWSGSAYK